MSNDIDKFSLLQNTRAMKKVQNSLDQNSGCACSLIIETTRTNFLNFHVY